MEVQGRTFGFNSLLLLIAVIILVLAAFGANVGGLSELDLVALGAAVGFGSFLV